MGRVKNAKKKASQARGSVDKAQTSLINANAKAIASMQASIEKKFIHRYGTDLPIEPLESTDYTLGIVPIKVGTTLGFGDAGNRIGDKITVKNIGFQYNLQTGNGSVSPAPPVTRIRVLMFWDNDPVRTSTVPSSLGAYESNPPQWNQILQSVDLTMQSGDPSVILSHHDHDKSNRFSFLYDEIHTLTSNGNTALTSQAQSALGLGSRSATNKNGFVKSYKRGKLLSFFNGGVLTTNRQLYLATISDSGAGYPTPMISYSLKVLYEDA